MSSPSLFRRTTGGAHASEIGETSGETAGQRLDLGSLYNEHADAVARWAARLAGPSLDVEDIVHEVFLVACRRLAEFRGEAKITTWLYEITVRIVQERRRSHARWRWLFGAAGSRSTGADAAGGDETSGIATDQPSALELLERRETSARLYEVLDGLPERYRTALILFELEGLSGEQIAAITDTTVANVWIRLFRGRRQFMKRLMAREQKDTP